MFLALHGEPSSIDAFEYQLAEHLHCTLSEVREMARSEYVGWGSYLKVKNEMMRVAMKKGSG